MAYQTRNPNGQATMADSSPVVLASDQSSVSTTIQDQAGNNPFDTLGVAKVDVQNEILPIRNVPQESGGLDIFRLISANTTNATSVKASAGQIYNIVASNTNNAVRFLKIYDSNTAPTVGSDIPIMTLALPGLGHGISTAVSFVLGVQCFNGIAFALTTAVADTDTTAVGADEIVVNILYK